MNKDATNRLQSLSDFWNAGSLELDRLNKGTWKEVDGVMTVDKHEGRTRITVPGRLHGRNLRNKLFMVSDVKLEIIANEPEQHEVWLSKIRARIAPWDLLRQEMKDASGIEELGIALGGLSSSTVGAEPSSVSTDEVEEKRRDKLVKLPEKLQRLSIVDELTAHGTAAVETGATLTKLVASVERVAETAEFVADVTKCAAGVSTVFQLISLSAQGVSMCVEANRGRRMLPVALGQITILLKVVLESLTKIMNSSQSVNETAVDYVFDALKETVCIMNLAEAQLFRGRISQIVNAEDVKKVERKIEELKQMAVTADNTSRICVLDEKVKRLEEGCEIRSLAPHHVRPSLSAFFSGRSKELKSLKSILEKHGSAVITQYGGIGKTELMIAFADRAERDKQVPGGVFWVTVDGGVKDVLDSLAGLAEKLTRRRMSEDERRNANLVILSLKQGLSEKQGRWLLCLDNADDSEVSGILNEVCGIAKPSQGNGWIVVTSRQGQPHIWDRMKSEQKLALEPLCAEDAMVTLWRQVQKTESGDADDDKVMKEIQELEGVNQVEYCAMKKLCGGDSGHGLGGLPLALVQAGSFIAQFKYSFADYLDLFENVSNENWEDIMNKTNEVKQIRESQRSIWTTWKISVQKLSGKAYTVLQAMAILGRGGIGERMMNEILIEVAVDGDGTVGGMFRNIIAKELMHGSSLIWRDDGEGEEEERRMYRMHRLVRMFILKDLGRGSLLWNNVYIHALLAVHHAVETELEEEGYSFNDLPDVFKNSHYKFVAHSRALVHHHVVPGRGSEVRNVSEVEDIHEYSGMVMEFMGKWEEEVQVWEHLLDILHHQETENRSSCSIEDSSDMSQYENRRKDERIRIANVYHRLGRALMEAGEFNSAASKIEQSLEMRREIYGHGKPDPGIATSLGNLGIVYARMGVLDKALERNKQSLEMLRAIHGHDKLHPNVAWSLNNLGTVYSRMGELDKTLEKLEQSLEMYRAIYGHEKPHPTVAGSLNNLGSVYEDFGKQDKALEKYQQSLEMYRAIHGHGTPHPLIAGSLDNLGNVYLAMDKLDKAQEKHEQSLEMRRAIYGHSKTHPDIASSLNNLGNVYVALGKQDKAVKKYEESLEMLQEIHGHGTPHPHIAVTLNNLGDEYRVMGELDKALEMIEQSLKMFRAIHRHSKLHPAIAWSLKNLADVCTEMGKLEEALEKHEQSLAMRRVIYGHNKPHFHTAKSLRSIGIVYHKQKKLNHAVDFLEQSLEMLRIVHGRHSLHPEITAVQSDLAKVYEDQGRQDEPCKKKRRIET